MRTGSANLTRRSVLVVSVTLSLLSVESALDDEVPAPKAFLGEQLSLADLAQRTRPL